MIENKRLKVSSHLTESPRTTELPVVQLPKAKLI